MKLVYKGKRPLKNLLSVFVPVLNCQSTVQALVGRLLEASEELTHRFELLVIDNGSTDATRESLGELVVCYPQLKLVNNPTRTSAAEVMRVGLRHSSGEIILYRREGCEAGSGCLAEMWQAARSADVVVTGRGHHSLGAIPASPAVLPSEAPAWQMIRRRLLEAWARQRAESDWLRYLQGRGFRSHEVEARSSTWRAEPQGRVAARLPNAPRHSPQPVPAEGRAAARRPNYLDRIKAFAWGE